MDRYADRLALDFPHMHDGFLREGCLGTLSEDPLRLKLWRSLIRYVRSRTISGMWVHNPDTGAKGLYKHLRYSPGVRELHGAGLQLKLVAGDNLVSIDEP
jgi:hypothetical protein